MELETFPTDEKLSLGMEQEMGGWEETKEELLPRTKEQIVASLEKIYGPSISCNFSENNESFALVVEEEACMLSNDTLKSFLPQSSYDAISSYFSSPLTSYEKEMNITEVEELVRLAFQNGTEIPPECHSVLYQLRNRSSLMKEEVRVGEKRLRK
jgi:hypothetical protein